MDSLAAGSGVLSAETFLDVVLDQGLEVLALEQPFHHRLVAALDLALDEEEPLAAHGRVEQALGVALIDELVVPNSSLSETLTQLAQAKAGDWKIYADAAYGGRLSEAQKRRVGFSPWLYPPLFVTIAVPLAYLPPR